MNSDKDEVTINTAGTYKIEFTTLMQSTDQKLFRTEIFKVMPDYPTCQKIPKIIANIDKYDTTYF